MTPVPGSDNLRKDLVRVRTSLRGTLVVPCVLLMNILLAQPQWRFHLAFEDATGAHDTIWFVHDTTATLGWDGNPEVDTALGEGRVDMDLDVFNVYTYNWDLDSTKTVAYPYTFFPSHAANIEAFNFQFPVILRWDTALFRASYLPDPFAINTAQMHCNHFFSFNNDPYLQAYNMLLDDSVSVELMFPNDVLFPLGVFFDHINLTSSSAQVGRNRNQLMWPNPVANIIKWDPHEPRYGVNVFDTAGRPVLIGPQGPVPFELDVSSLPDGMYILKWFSNSNQRCHETFIKRD